MESLSIAAIGAAPAAVQADEGCWTAASVMMTPAETLHDTDSDLKIKNLWF